ncbi:hypothetical protein AAG570_005124 [Ranatra chinensis]|uniref:C3H1-type domain-containing protein n=1 Tax=Ranatra chinensis TaxID=642074 RepID=A0ABD0Y0F9_9HEMI
MGREEEGDVDRPICRDFLRKICSRGDSCKYYHPENKLVFCHDYQNGKCKRNDCIFIHCSRDDEYHYNQFGQLPPHLTELPQVNNHLADLSDVPLCKDYQKGECVRAVCKFRHVLLPQQQQQQQQQQPPQQQQQQPPTHLIASYLHTLEDENAMLHKTVAELRKRVDDLQATNEFLLEQNAQMRLGEKSAGITAMTVPTVTITNAPPIPQAALRSVTASVATVPVSIAAVAVATPVSLATVSMAAGAMQQQPQEATGGPAQALLSQQTASIVSYPLVARPVMPASLTH